MTWGELKHAVDERINDEQKIRYIDVTYVWFDDGYLDIEREEDEMVVIS